MSYSSGNPKAHLLFTRIHQEQPLHHLSLPKCGLNSYNCRVLEKQISRLESDFRWSRLSPAPFRCAAHCVFGEVFRSGKVKDSLGIPWKTVVFGKGMVHLLLCRTRSQYLGHNWRRIVEHGREVIVYGELFLNSHHYYQALLQISFSRHFQKFCPCIFGFVQFWQLANTTEEDPVKRQLLT